MVTFETISNKRKRADNEPKTDTRQAKMDLFCVRPSTSVNSIQCEASVPLSAARSLVTNVERDAAVPDALVQMSDENTTSSASASDEGELIIHIHFC